MRTLRARAAAVALAGVAVLLPAGGAGAGQGSGNPTIASSPATLTGNGPWTVTVTGTDYLVPPYTEGAKVDGGVYLFFGWVAPDRAKWGPSGRNAANGDGNFGVTYAYPGQAGGPPAAGAEQPATSTTSFVAFTDSDDPEAETEFVMDRDGNWTAQLSVPGPTFTTKLFSGEDKTFDCRVDTCGVYTMGAHGRVSPTNEKFARITFPAAQPTVAPTPTPTPSRTPTPTPTPNPDAPGGTTDDPDDAGYEPLPKTGIDDESSAGVPRTSTLDGEIVAVGIDEVRDTGSGGLALFGVAALAALVIALTASLFLRYGRGDPGP